VLHAYDADDIRRELWNSLEVPERDDCGEYSKMAPPTIANGRVYLASFGMENVGTGQLCVYGLLPVAGKNLATPIGARADVARGNVALTWDPTPGATFYRVARSSSLESGWKTVATGLTMPKFTEPAPERGESVTYTVLAVGHDGVSAASDPVRLAPRKATPVEQ
jgi:hypothetical protein